VEKTAVAGGRQAFSHPKTSIVGFSIHQEKKGLVISFIGDFLQDLWVLYFCKYFLMKEGVLNIHKHFNRPIIYPKT